MKATNESSTKRFSKQTRYLPPAVGGSLGKETGKTFFLGCKFLVAFDPGDVETPLLVHVGDYLGFHE
jgi:hypothetical protein